MWFTYNMLMLAHAFYLQSSDFCTTKLPRKIDKQITVNKIKTAELP